MNVDSEEFKAIEGTYLDAIRHIRQDYASAMTPEDVRALEANWVRIESIYLDALDNVWPKNTDQARKALQQANKAVKSARDETAKFAKLLSKMVKATDAAEELLKGLAK